MKEIEIYNDSFQNYKSYHIPKAQLILTDVPYNLGEDAYASNPTWYEGGETAEMVKVQKLVRSSFYLYEKEKSIHSRTNK